METFAIFFTRVGNHVTNLSNDASNFLLAIDFAVCSCLPSIHFCGMFGIKLNAILIQSLRKLRKSYICKLITITYNIFSGFWCRIFINVHSRSTILWANTQTKILEQTFSQLVHTFIMGSLDQMKNYLNFDSFFVSDFCKVGKCYAFQNIGEWWK